MKCCSVHIIFLHGSIKVYAHHKELYNRAVSLLLHNSADSVGTQCIIQMETGYVSRLWHIHTFSGDVTQSLATRAVYPTVHP